MDFTLEAEYLKFRHSNTEAFHVLVPLWIQASVLIFVNVENMLAKGNACCQPDYLKVSSL